MYLFLVLSLIFNIIFIVFILKQRGDIESLIYDLRTKENIIDIDRLQKAIDTPRYQIAEEDYESVDSIREALLALAPDLTKEQKRQHIINSAK